MIRTHRQDRIQFLFSMTTGSKILKGKVALVTGAAKRLGKASALALASAGADVAMTYLRSKREADETLEQIKALGVQGLILRCDVTDQSSVRSAVKKVVQRFGRIDILVNN